MSEMTAKQKRISLASETRRIMVAERIPYDKAFQVASTLHSEWANGTSEPAALSYRSERRGTICNAEEPDSSPPGQLFLRLVKKTTSELSVSYSLAWNLAAKTEEGKALLEKMKAPSQDTTMHWSTENHPALPDTTGGRVYPPHKRDRKGPMGDARPPGLQANPDALREFEHQTT